jgi:hypothetical protein
MVFGSAARIVGPLWGGFATGLKSPNNTQIMASFLVAMFAIELLVTLVSFPFLFLLLFFFFCFHFSIFFSEGGCNRLKKSPVAIKEWLLS